MPDLFSLLIAGYRRHRGSAEECLWQVFAQDEWCADPVM